MRIITVICVGLLFSIVNPASAAVTYTFGGQISSNPNLSLIETNQSQIFEPMSFLLKRDLPRLAAVNFITGSRQLEFSGVEFNDPSIDECKAQGYEKNNCPSGQKLVNQCPLNPSYYKTCCDNSYNYNKSDCTYPMTTSAESCGGKYKCYCDRSLYSITGCTAPQVVSTGDSCTEGGTTYYARCQCPSTYNQSCTGTNMQGSGTGCTKNSLTKYTACECKPGYNMTCSDLGPTSPTNYCLLNGIKYYNSCKTCANKCSISAADKQTGVTYEYEDCSDKYCELGCATGYTNWCTKPETNCGTLGYTKSVSQCSNGYLTCPYNSAAVFCEDEDSTSGIIPTPSGRKCEDIVGCVECETLDISTGNAICTKCQSGYLLSTTLGTCLLNSLKPQTCEYGWYDSSTCCTKAQSDDCKIPTKPCLCYVKEQVTMP